MAEPQSLRRNLLFLAGMTLAAVSFAFGVVLILSEAFFENRNPYSAVVTYMVIPSAIAVGLGLAALGLLLAWLRRRRHAPDRPLPTLDLNRGRTRRLVLATIVAIAIFFAVSAVATYRGFVYTESTEFCGNVCHAVMDPEFTAHQTSPHARVECVACHIGGGADWYVRSKVSGLRQVWRTLTDSYELPIEVPVRNLRPARETCEHCHWPEVFTGSVERVQWHFWYDEANTPSVYHMLMRVGGRNPTTGVYEGIHWHTSANETVRYWARDRERLDIPWVEVTHADGTSTVYASGDDLPEGGPPEGEIRTMDCIDCHNRPAHIYRPPDTMINQALVAGRLDGSLPEIKATAVDLLLADYDAREQARTAIAEGLTERYGGDAEPSVTDQAIDRAAEVVIAIYDQTHFPEQEVSWRTYPDHIGHRRFPGCFRCHDGSHRAEGSDAVISMECATCHDFVFQAHDQAAYGPVVYQSGPWEHPEGIPDMHEGLLCTDCHGAQLDED